MVCAKPNLSVNSFGANFSVKLFCVHAIQIVVSARIADSHTVAASKYGPQTLAQTFVWLKTVVAWFWFSKWDMILHLQNVFCKKFLVVLRANVFAHSNSECNYLGGPLIWGIFPHDKICDTHTTISCIFHGKNATNLGKQTKFRHLIKPVAWNNIEVYLSSMHKYFTACAMPEINSKRMYAQSRIRLTPKPAKLARVISKIFLGFFKTKHF